jgi:hypothetical protein
MHFMTVGRAPDADAFALNLATRKGNMKSNRSLWLWCVLPVLTAWASFTGLNALWNYCPVVGRYFPYDLAVDLLGGSGIALVILFLTLWGGRVTHQEVGLALSGWQSWKRLLGLLAVGAVLWWSYLAYPGQGAQSFVWNFSIWFVLLLAASLAEILVFLSVTFCLTEHALKERGLLSPLATLAAMLLAALAFGLFHYSYPERWHPLVWKLTGVFFLVLLFFALTRNLYLTLLLHTAFAVKGFLYQQSAADPLDLVDYLAPPVVCCTVTAFVVPFVILHILEIAPGGRERNGKTAPGNGVSPPQPHPGNLP